MSIDERVRYECDDNDDPERGVLEVFFAGNGDWYAGVQYAERKTASEKGIGFLPAVRFRTSGGSHPLAVVLCIAILYDIGRGNLDGALYRAKALTSALEPGEHGRDIENHWPSPEEK